MLIDYPSRIFGQRKQMTLFNWPLILFFVTFLLLWFALGAGSLLRRRTHEIPEVLRADFGIVLGATLTLLGLLIGFTFSMATSRYDSRISLEASEANAIGTEYVRLDFLPAEQQTQVQALLRRYTELRVKFFTADHEKGIQAINTETDAVGRQMWRTTSQAALQDHSALAALVASGMNDVLNSRDYTQAARWNRIPVAAWLLMFLIAALANVLLGYGAKGKALVLSLVLPLTVSICFFLIADIDSPAGGMIRTSPRDLMAVSQSMKQ
jgi:hypothetical protein